MKTLAYLLIIIIFSSLSCKKDDHSGYVNRNTIVLGDQSNMLVTSYDTILVGWYHNAIYLDLDINCDNINDLRLISEIWGSPGLGQHPRSQIACLNPNCFLFGINKTDTFFLYKTITILEGNDGKVDIYKYFNYTCNRIHNEDSITGTSTVFKIVALAEKDTLYKKDYFKSDTVMLVSNDYSYPPNVIFRNDTTIHEVLTFINNCNSFPLDEFVYIGLKISDLGSEKLGWIKLSISDKYKISILESAIQK